MRLAAVALLGALAAPLTALAPAAPVDAAPWGLAPRAIALQGAESVLAAVDRDRDIHVSVRVETLEGEVVLDHDGATPRVLASNTKLLTSSAALLALDPDSRWHTRCYLDGGRLWIVGDGDPSLLRTPLGDGGARFLDALVAALEEAEVEQLEEVVLDARAFPGPTRPPGWPEDDWHKYYCAPSAALQVGGSRISVQLAGGRPRILPPLGDALKVVRSDPRRDNFAVWWQGEAELVVQGGLTLPEPVEVSVKDPLWLYREWLEYGLKQRGVRAQSLREAGAEEVLPEGEPLLEHPSMWTLAEAVAVVNKDSDNQLAESLLLTLGLRVKGEGTREAGLAAVRETLAEAEVDLSGMVQVDGSGMARGATDADNNRAAPATLCAVLRAMAEEERGRVLFLSLPVAGEEGRLASRFRDAAFDDGRVRAKTGYITGASSLSGFLHAHDGTLLVFSIVVNYKPDGTKRTWNSRFKRMQEEMLEALLEEQPWT